MYLNMKYLNDFFVDIKVIEVRCRQKALKRKGKYF